MSTQESQLPDPLVEAQTALERIRFFKRALSAHQSMCNARGQALADKIAYWESVLEKYSHDLSRDYGSKTVTLPDGVVRFREARGSLEIENPAEMVAWLETRKLHACLRTKTSTLIDKDAVRKALKTNDAGEMCDPQTGEIAPCKVVGAGLESMSYKFNGEEAGDA